MKCNQAIERTEDVKVKDKVRANEGLNKSVE